MFLRLVDRQVLALQLGANREAHSRDHAGRFAELQPEEGLPGGMRRLLHRGDLTGREPSPAILRSRSGGNAGKRSEERRVGKECRSWGWGGRRKEKEMEVKSYRK